jgi:hypothetical protein
MTLSNFAAFLLSFSILRGVSFLWVVSGEMN